jgi:hypothetical protein
MNKWLFGIIVLVAVDIMVFLITGTTLGLVEGGILGMFCFPISDWAWAKIWPDEAIIQNMKKNKKEAK